MVVVLVVEQTANHNEGGWQTGSMLFAMWKIHWRHCHVKCVYTTKLTSLITFFNPSWPGLPELRQDLGGGRSALPLKKSKIRLKTTFFKVCHCLHYIKIIIVKVGLAKEKCLQKKLLRKNPRGGRSAPPPRPTRVKRLSRLSALQCTLTCLPSERPASGSSPAIGRSRLRSGSSSSTPSSAWSSSSRIRCCQI